MPRQAAAPLTPLTPHPRGAHGTDPHTCHRAQALLKQGFQGPRRVPRNQSDKSETGSPRSPP